MLFATSTNAVSMMTGSTGSICFRRARTESPSISGSIRSSTTADRDSAFALKGPRHRCRRLRHGSRRAPRDHAVRVQYRGRRLRSGFWEVEARSRWAGSLTWRSTKPWVSSYDRSDASAVIVLFSMTRIQVSIEPLLNGSSDRHRKDLARPSLVDYPMNHFTSERLTSSGRHSGRFSPLAPEW